MRFGNMETSSTLSMEEELMAARENRFELLKLLSELGALDRDILVMKLIQGISNKEIAVHLGLVEYTVEIRIHDALKKWDV
ncbi:sigma factor-like helix-turn-helix DNA-binding protein [Planococcus sp. APC 3906]|uniref:RNA polymerase sigma factor n=1 Tax=Planococcus sp. APC 3906 TaxID=3035194 RepID=UPI0025B51535|nr:sigma factor-like helix-turn-helix DNA-binding protein [Planococcus sp. APC 3906]MDN3451685.1 sigma factor-like helix-turn-helix DNA-binding protein [Planococcus sp. APC 3906]